MNPTPIIPMLPGAGSGKALLVIGVLVALAISSNRKAKQSPQS
jgi:hypothetical protein